MTSRIKEKKANKHKVKLNRFQVGLIKRKAGERERERKDKQPMITLRGMAG